MSLRPCAECGAQVSTRARTCPSCGAPMTKGGAGCAGCLVGCLIVLLVIAGGAYLLYGYLEGQYGEYRDVIMEKIEQFKDAWP